MRASRTQQAKASKKDSAISDRVLTCDYRMFSVTTALPITGQKWRANCTFTSIVALIICVVRSLRVMNFDRFVDVANFVSMRKGKVDVIRPTCMAGDNFGVKSTLTQNAL